MISNVKNYMNVFATWVSGGFAVIRSPVPLMNRIEREKTSALKEYLKCNLAQQLKTKICLQVGSSSCRSFKKVVDALELEGDLATGAKIGSRSLEEPLRQIAEKCGS